MIKKQKKLIIGLAVAFVVLLVLYFAVIRPLTAEVEDDSPVAELMDGEVMITTKTENFYIFEPIARSSIQSIEVENAYGGFKIYRDASDTFQLDGFMGIQFDEELFSSFVVTAGYPTAMMRVATDVTEEELAEFGLAEPQASWTLTTVTGEEYTILVGDMLLTEGGYYVKYEPRDTVYILSTALADTMLQPGYKLFKPILTAGMTSNDYYMVDEFAVWKNGDLFVNIGRVPDDQKEDPDAIVENYMTFPAPAAVEGSEKTRYDLNTDTYYTSVYNFISLAGDEVVAFRPTEEELAEFKLDDPKYIIRFVFEGYEFVVLASEQLPDGGYYAVSNLYGYEMVCHIPATTVDESTGQEMAGALSWLEFDKFSWIFPTPFFENITAVARMTLKGEGVDVDFTLTHGTDSDGNNTLEVYEANNDVTILNSDVGNFRQYYKTMLNITNQEYATLSDEDKAALTADEGNVVLTMTYEGVDGSVNEYKFYKYIEESTGKISGGKLFVTVNGIGEFYTTNDLVEKVMKDTPRVLRGLDIDSYGKN